MCLTKRNKIEDVICFVLMLKARTMVLVFCLIELPWIAEKFNQKYEKNTQSNSKNFDCFLFTKRGYMLKNKSQYMFKTGKIISFEPVLIEYPKEAFDILETDYSQEKGLDKYQIPVARYFSPFQKLNDFLGTDNLNLESLYIWITYDENREIIQDPIMKLNKEDLILLKNPTIAFN